jgi:hypothetical protein
LVVRVGGVEGDEGVVREAFDAGLLDAFEFNFLIHDHNSADAVAATPRNTSVPILRGPPTRNSTPL